MPFKAYEEFTDGPIEVPYRGKTYTIPLPNIEAGATLLKMLTNEDGQGDRPVEDLWKIVLGDLWGELLADGVPHAFLARVALTAITDFQFGREMAEVVWEAGLDPKAMEGYLSTLGVEPPATPTTSTSTDEATTTPSAAPGSSTTSPKARTSRSKKAPPSST